MEIKIILILKCYFTYRDSWLEMKKIGKNKIFLEFDEKFKKSKLIPLRLCISGEYLGTLDSPTYVTSFINSLKNLLTDSYYYSEFINDENYKCFFTLKG